ncbi:nicotinate-nucleotide--dimethylbenzimidazole phosphoribosyltransferase, partial [Salmonella enterica subsp. enterica serovar Lubbock]|nr:nicotinate-nucleotide--dimethylbenzimidazole phosphoribosyltransferase [Salmonella enterica subsp. enterica serovar Lubbock]
PILWNMAHAASTIGIASAAPLPSPNRIALAHLSMEPYLHMAMRLGEGSGAALAMPIVEAACAMFHNMGELAASNIVLPEGNASAT